MPILTEEERLGTLVGNKYRLDAMRDRGATGVTYDAVDVVTEARVAVHVLSAVFTSDEDAVARFLREAMIAAELRHPHMASVYALGADDPYTVWIARERLDGESLAAFVGRRGRLSPRETVELLWPIFVALEAAHSQGIVHRAIDMANVFLSVDAEGHLVPKLLELGVAKLLQQSAASKTTHAGFVVGSPHYMSPEQVLGMPAITPALDIWSLGVVIYACVAGTLPFPGGDTGAILGAISQGEYVPLSVAVPGVEPEFAAAVAKALSPLSNRYATVLHFGLALASSVCVSGVSEPSVVPNASRPPSSSFSPPPARVVVPVEAVPAASPSIEELGHVPEQRAMKAGARLGKVAVALFALFALIALGISGVEHLVRQGVTEALDARNAAERTRAAEVIPSALVPAVVTPPPAVVTPPPAPVPAKPTAPVASPIAPEVSPPQVATTPTRPSVRPIRASATSPSPSRPHTKLSNLSREF